MLRTKIAVLVSGGGTNLQALIDAQECGMLNSGEISLVVSSNDSAFALERARKHRILSVTVSKKSCGSQADFEKAIQTALTEHGIELVDFKLEFGKLADGTIVLADEISPDTCRLWDVTTHEKLDKDRFRRDLGGVEDAYNEVMKRLLGDTK